MEEVRRNEKAVSASGNFSYGDGPLIQSAFSVPNATPSSRLRDCSRVDGEVSEVQPSLEVKCGIERCLFGGHFFSCLARCARTTLRCAWRRARFHRVRGALQRLL